jgi:hypothetical protein
VTFSLFHLAIHRIYTILDFGLYRVEIEAPALQRRVRDFSEVPSRHSGALCAFGETVHFIYAETGAA